MIIFCLFTRDASRAKTFAAFSAFSCSSCLILALSLALSSSVFFLLDFLSSSFFLSFSSFSFCMNGICDECMITSIFYDRNFKGLNLCKAIGLFLLELFDLLCVLIVSFLLARLLVFIFLFDGVIFFFL